MQKTNISAPDFSKRIKNEIFSVPKQGLAKGAWLWWFWLFFIHTKDTAKTGKCRQIMILWSIKNDSQISVNGLDIRVKKQIIAKGDKINLDGAAAAWYFDGEKMHDDFVLEKSMMLLDSKNAKLSSPGSTPSSFERSGPDCYLTKIKTKNISFELEAKQTDFHPVVGPVHGSTKLLAGLFNIEGTRIERLELSGTQTADSGKIEKITGSAYFQKIYLGAPPPQWYWGIYHFSDGSIATYMQAYVGRAMLKDVATDFNLKNPSASALRDFSFYHAPSKKVYEVHGAISVIPKKIGKDLYEHDFFGECPEFSFKGKTVAYAHSAWKFRKNIGALPIKSTFVYNEYPAVMELTLTPFGQAPISLKNGVGNMENAWGFLI